ncbi:MAG: superoxide dismutase [Methanospirillum sp.]
METKKFYTLPPLPYGYGDLTPAISEEQLRIHHDKHHNAYVVAANDLLEKMDAARKSGADLDMKATLKAFSFNVGGHTLHSIFWKNMAPAGKGGGGAPSGAFADAINAEFGSFERFKKEFSAAATSAEGSGWAALSICRMTGRPIIMQIEKHNVNVYPGCAILMVLDVWEHAYYLDYKNDRAKFVENFWQIANWNYIGERFEAAQPR